MTADHEYEHEHDHEQHQERCLVAEIEAKHPNAGTLVTFFTAATRDAHTILRPFAEVIRMLEDAGWIGVSHKRHLRTGTRSMRLHRPRKAKRPIDDALEHLLPH